MEIVPLAVIGLVALMGLVAIAVGHKGWSWGTVVAAVLLLFAATGYIYLAARLAERERAWRVVVSKNQAEIDRIVGSGAPGPAAEPKSLAALQDERDRWARARNFVDTWHGRRWTGAKFTPPRGGKPGSISIDMPSEEAKSGPVDVGAEVAVFDQDDVGNGGRFLGLFRVVKATAAEGAENAVLSIEPASAPDAPGPEEIKHWTRNDVDATVYESMPVDRWLAFHRTPLPAADAAVGTPADAGARWRPEPQKVAADDLLASLEQEIDAVRRHGQAVPEDDWQALFQTVHEEQRKRADRTLAPGLYWATVEFTRNVKFTKKERFTADDAPPDDPAAGDEEDDEDIGAPGAPIEPGAPVGGEAPSGDASPLDPTAGAATNRFKQRRYTAGERVEFDLETALELQDEKWAKITSVVERRPLADPYTAIRGSRFEPFFDVNDKKRVALTSEGIDALRRGLIAEMKSIEEAGLKVTASRANVERQAAATAEQKQQLDVDNDKWQRDVKVSANIADAFDNRLKSATIELAAMEATIVRLGQELDGITAKLTQAIDAAAPPPGR
jgi:hypothetical protein